jgi:hypothetical protein
MQEFVVLRREAVSAKSRAENARKRGDVVCGWRVRVRWQAWQDGEVVIQGGEAAAEAGEVSTGAAESCPRSIQRE